MEFTDGQKHMRADHDDCPTNASELPLVPFHPHLGIFAATLFHFLNYLIRQLLVWAILPHSDAPVQTTRCYHDAIRTAVDSKNHVFVSSQDLQHLLCVDIPYHRLAPFVAAHGKR